MKMQVDVTEYVEEWPLRPWEAVVRTGEAAAAASSSAAETGFVPSDGISTAAARPSRRDRGASAVEWVIITGIVVVIVVAVGAVISSALQKKASTTSDDIQNAHISGGT